MMRMKTKTTGQSPGSGGESNGHDLEVRPGGMLVQKRDADSDRSSGQPPMIRVKVKYASVYHEIMINSQATFGELKKMLSGPTGLHHQDQKLMYKDKERDSKAFLDISGVKDKSKMVLIEDPISKEKRLLEMRKTAKTEKASKAISNISLEVDRLAGRVSALETVINKGGKVAGKDVICVIELLMNELVKLDGIMGDGDVKLQRKIQVRRVQKYVETLDLLKIKNSQPGFSRNQTKSNGQRLEAIEEQPNRRSNGENELADRPRQTPIQYQKPVESLIDMPIYEQQHQQSLEIQEHGMYEKPKNNGSGPAVNTAWETFDSMSMNRTSAPQATSAHSIQPRFNWEFFD